MTRFTVICAMVLAAVLVISPTTQAITIEFAPAGQTVVLGSPASVDVNISGLTGALTLGAYDLNINFSSTILSTPTVTFGTGLSLGLIGGSTTGVSGTNPRNVFEVSLILPPSLLAANQPDSFRLFTLAFNTLALGTSPLSLSDIILGDEFGENITPRLTTVGTGSITVTPVPDNGGGNPIPEPSTWMLMASGLVLLCLGRRRLACSRV